MDLRNFARLCAISYDRNAIAKYESMGYRAKQLPTSKVEQLFWLEGDQGIVVVIAGTNQVQDWIINCLAIPLGLSFDIHPGYASIAGALAGEIAKLSNGRPITIVGHSKGGAIAALLGHFIRNAMVVTFGSPRIASDRFAAEYDNDRYLRVVNPLDIVCRLPAHAMGYRHCGQPIVFHNGEFIPDAAEWERLKKEHPLWRSALGGVRVLKQHFAYWA